jgi:hypothetical protein
VLAKVLAISVPALNILTFYSIIATVLFGACFYFFEGQHLYSVDPQFTNATLAAAAGGMHFPAGVYVRPDVTGLVRQTVTPVHSIAWAFWWVLTTITTVGYGDLFPTTFEGKLVGIITFYVGVITLALPITILGMNFEKVRLRSRPARPVSPPCSALLRPAPPCSALLRRRPSASATRNPWTTSTRSSQSRKSRTGAKASSMSLPRACAATA